MTAQVCGTCSHADCQRAGRVETCEHWSNTDDEETMTFQAYTDGEDTIYGTSPDEAVEAYQKEIGIGPNDMGKPEDFKPVDHGKTQKITDENTGITETKTIGEWIEFRQREEKPSRLICTKNW